MDADSPSSLPTWPYWVAVPICSLAYAGFCTWFMLEAWGKLGETKPAWFDVAYFLACPGMFLIPIPVIGPLVVGAAVSFVMIWFPRQLFESK